MAIDPSIALGVKPFEITNPLVQYGQIATIQNAQNQNALAQYQIESARRADATKNALSLAYKDAYDPTTGNIDANKLRQSLASGGFGAELPTVEKGLLEIGKLKTETQKAEMDLIDSKLKQSRGFLDTIDPANPNAPAQYIAWHEANHKDPVLGPVLAARGVTADQARGRIMDAINKGPEAFATLLNQSKLGTEKFMELNKPTTTTVNRSGQTDIVSRPGLGGTPTTVGTYADVPLPPEVVAQQKELRKAGATNVTNTTINSPTGKSLSEPVGKRVEASLSRAEGAAGMRVNANLVQEALNSGKVIAGPMAGPRTTIAQVLNMAGANNRDQLQNSLTVAKGLAGLTLESRGELKGQGQITDPETKLLEKARSGDTNLTLDELQQVVNISNRMSSRLWQNHQTLLQTMEKDPAAAGSINYYRPTSQLDDPVAPATGKQEPAKGRPTLNSIFGKPAAK